MEEISVVPQTTEKNGQVDQSVPPERIQERHGDQIVEVPVPLITEKNVNDVFGLPQERVQNRATYTGKVFTVCHCTVDNVGFVKGLDKYNMVGPGDVMVPVPQINQGTVAVSQHAPQEPIELVPAGHVEQVVSWFDRNPRELHWTSLCTVFRQSARAAAAAPTSHPLEPLLQIF